MTALSPWASAHTPTVPLPLLPIDLSTVLIIVLGAICLALLTIVLQTKLRVHRVRREAADEYASLERMERILRTIVEGTVAATGEEFFRRLARELSTALGCACAAVAQTLDDGQTRGRTLAVWCRGNLLENMEYDVQSSPCRCLLEDGVSIFPEGVQRRFPGSPMLRAVGAESYLGTALRDVRGEVIGFLFVMDDRPMREIDFTKSILQIFANRVVSEIERIRAESALRLSEQIHRESIEHAAGVPYRLRFGEHLSDSKYDFMGAGALEILGIPPEALDHARFASLIEKHQVIYPEGEDDPEKIAEGFRVGRIRHYRAELCIRTPDGRERWISDNSVPLIDDRSGRVIGSMGILHDITADKRREQALRDREAALVSILRVAPIGIGLVRDRTLEWVSDHICTMVGRGPEQLIGQSARILYPTQEEFERVEQVKCAAIEATGMGMIDTQWIHSDGAIIDVDLRSTPINPDDLSEGTTFTVIDITERKRAESERKRLEHQILYAQKLESLGILAGGIAHDFNNLLVAMLGNASLALADLPPESPTRDSIQQIETAAERAADLCRQMLAYSGRGQFIVEPLNLSRLVEQMVHILEVTIGRRAALRLNLEADLPLVDGDSSQIRQVVMNLITNASEAIGEKTGVITVTTGHMSCDTNYLGESFFDQDLPAGDYVFLEVSDTGCGMDQTTQANIFDPFFTTKFTGRGLGMAAVLGIVRGHQGAIRVYSERERGSAIKILFPISDSTHVQDAEPIDDDAQWRGGRGTILIADDEEGVRHLMERTLRRAGFETMTASDGREAVEILRTKGDSIDAVILDLTMPHMDGSDAFREMRRMRPDVRVLLSSGYSEQEVRALFTGKGLAGFIQKPFRSADLIGKVRAITSEESRD